jgi:hypothetical protein
MIIVEQEAWETLRRDCQILIERNWQEIALHQDEVPLLVDWPRYERMNKDGLVDAVTVRDNGVLVGYNVFFYGRPIHYSGTMVATNDVLYLAPEYRKGSLGIRLIKKGEEVWMRRADMCVMHAKPHNYLGRILERLGYGVAEIMYHKVKGK